MKHILISTGIFTGMVCLFLFDWLMDKLPAWSHSALKYIIIAGIFAVIGDTVFGTFYKPSPEEVAVMRIDMFLSRAGSASASEENMQNDLKQ